MLIFIGLAKKFFARMTIAVVITTALSVTGIVMVNNMINSRFNKLNRTNVNLAEDTGASEPANFLIIGSDSRDFVESEQDKNSFTDSEGESGQRSDTMMIVRVDPKAKKTVVMAIPRDTKVNIPGIGTQKINASFNSDLGGGPDKVVETIQDNFGISIQHYVELDFDSFRQIVSALGTVKVYFPAPARDKKSGLDIPEAGCIALNGDQALSYVRSRYYEQFIDGKWQSDPTSNYGRIARQQEFMRRVASLAVKRSFTDPLKGRDVADVVIKKLYVDQNLKKDDIFKLMNAFKGVDPNDPEHVLFQTLPVKSEYQNGVSYDIVQEAEAEPMLEIFRNLSTESSDDTDTTLPRPTTVKVSVLNASGEKGLAATTMTALQEHGFVPSGTGNASSRSRTEIHYTKGHKDKAQLVATYINGVLIQDSSIADADVVVMLGSDFTGVTNAKTSTTAASSSSTPTTTGVKPSINGVSTEPCDA